MLSRPCPPWRPSGRPVPGAEITWLVEEAAAPILAYHPALDNLLISRRRSWLAAWRQRGHGKPPGRNSASWCKPSAAAPTTSSLISRVCSKAPSGLPWPAVPAKSALTAPGNTATWPSPNVCRPMTLTSMPSGAICGWPNIWAQPGSRCASGWPCRPGPVRTWNTLWQEKTGPLIVMHPGTRWPSKHWPPESFASLADALIRERQARVVFTGSPADRPLISRIRSLMTDAGRRPERPDRFKIPGPIILSGRRRRHHRHRPHASGRGRGHPGGRRLRPHRALAHRSLSAASTG